MGEKRAKPTLDQITDQMEELEVDQQQSNKGNVRFESEEEFCSL